MEATENKKIKKSVRIRMKKDEMKEFKEKNAGRLGAVTASLKNIPTAPRKMRLVADMIRGERVNVALNILRFDNKHASNTMEKVLLTAISDWQQQNEDVNIEEADLFVKEVLVDGGRMLKRLQTAPQGRAHRIRKRSNHITITVDDRNKQEVTEEPKTENEE